MISVERPLAYMVALDLAGRRCLVLGGGEMAAQRVPGLLDSGAHVVVIAATLTAELQLLADRGDVELTAREYRHGDLRGAFLALNTSDDRSIEALVAGEARRERVLLNTIDRPAACNFATPALVRRGHLQVAVSTSGESPSVAAAVRRRLETVIGEEWGSLLSVVGRVRRRLRREGVDPADQLRVYRALVSHESRVALRDGASEAEMVEAASAPDARGPRQGSVHLVGAGPGDPGLLTVTASELLVEADVVFHDALVSPAILRICRPGTELVDVGKRGGGARTEQEDITAAMIAAARAGREVVRLKGGDPFLFGRGGEELAALRDAGIDAEVVPGISSALAAPAMAGIPLTLRGVAGSVAVVSGQGADGATPGDLERVAAAVDTLVVLMPLAALDVIATRLTRVLGADHPAAVIASATTSDQRVLRAPLSTIAAEVRPAGISAPATLILGRVVNAIAEPGAVAELAACVEVGAAGA